MAEPIHKDYRMEIREVEDGRYLQKVFIHISDDGSDGCVFTEEEYYKRKAKGQL